MLDGIQKLALGGECPSAEATTARQDLGKKHRVGKENRQCGSEGFFIPEPSLLGGRVVQLPLRTHDFRKLCLHHPISLTDPS